MVLADGDKLELTTLSLLLYLSNMENAEQQGKCRATWKMPVLSHSHLNFPIEHSNENEITPAFSMLLDIFLVARHFPCCSSKVKDSKWSILICPRPPAPLSHSNCGVLVEVAPPSQQLAKPKAFTMPGCSAKTALAALALK